jgi:hypothetical protein
LCGLVVVLPVRIELTTSPLPRGCSTTELRQQPDEMNALKNRGDHCHMGGIRASALPAGPLHISLWFHSDRLAALIAWMLVVRVGNLVKDGAKRRRLRRS